MIIFKFFFDLLLKFFLILFFVVNVFFVFIFSFHLVNNNIVQIAFSQITNSTKSSLDLMNLPFFHNDEHEVITIMGSYNSFFNIIFSTDVFSHFSPLSDSSDYLKDFPGFSPIRSGGTNSDIVFRGMFGSRLHILNGSGEIFASCASRMDSSGAYIFPESFDIVTVIKGPQTVLWGPVVSGGVVHFERHNSRFYQPEMKIRTSTMIGSYNRVDKNIDTVFGSLVGYLRLIGTVSYSNDYLDAKNHIVPSAWYKWDTNMIFGFTPFSDLLFELTLSQSNGNAKYAGRGSDGICFSRESFEIRLKKDIIKNTVHSIDLTSWYHDINHVMGTDMSNINSSDKSLIKNKYSNDKDSKNCVSRLITGVRGILTYQWEDIRIDYGADMQINQHRRKIIHNDWYKDSYFQDIGLFIELDWQLALFSNVISGIRLQRTLVNDYFFQEEIRERSMTYPAGFMRYEHMFLLPNVLRTYIGIGANNRFPDYWELIILKSGKGMGRDAFYRLKEEKNIQLDFGGNFKSEKVDVWISSYAGYVKDFILYRYYDDYGLQNHNIFTIRSAVENINAITRGSEMGGCYRFNNNIFLESNISYVFGKNVTNFTPLPQLPPLDTKNTLIWKYGLWTSKWIWKVVAPQNRISVNDGNVISRDTNASKGFSIFSIHVLRHISHEIKLGFGVNNLLNKSYSEHLSMSGHKRFENLSGSPLCEPGRTWWMRLGMIF